MVSCRLGVSHRTVPSITFDADLQIFTLTAYRYELAALYNVPVELIQLGAWAGSLVPSVSSFCDVASRHFRAMVYHRVVPKHRRHPVSRLFAALRTWTLLCGCFGQGLGPGDCLCHQQVVESRPHSVRPGTAPTKSAPWERALSTARRVARWALRRPPAGGAARPGHAGSPTSHRHKSTS